MRKKMSLGATIALMAITCAITFSMTYRYAMSLFNQKMQSVTERQGIYEKLSEVDQKVREQYLGSIDETILMDETITGFISGIGDKYGCYMTAAEYQDEISSLEGKNVGMGAFYITRADGAIQFAVVDSSSPAAIGGLKKGDILLGANDAYIETVGKEAVLKQCNGDVGEKIVLHVLRDNVKMNVEVTCNSYEVISVRCRMLENKIAYISIDEFNAATVDQFKSALSSLKKEGATALIMDVRNNPGGTLDSVSQILDMLLPAGNIVSQKDKFDKKTVLYTSDNTQIDMPMVVLTNKNTASAAELFACAIRDYEKGTIVGDTTYGKGSIQQIFTLSDGSAFRMTIAKFYPPISDCFDGIGVVPDYAVSLTEEQSNNFYFLDEATDAQLKTAINVLYGEGVQNYVEPDPTEEDISSEEVSDEEASENTESTSENIAKAYACDILKIL